MLEFASVFAHTLAQPLGSSFVMARVELPIEALPFVLLGAAGIWTFRKAYALFVWLRTKPPSVAVEPRRRWLVGEKMLKALLGANGNEPMDVDVTVFAPPLAPPREEVLIQVIFHAPDKEAEAASQAAKAEPTAQRLASMPLTIALKRNDSIKVTLECAGTVMRESVQTTNWNGRLVCVYFLVQMPAVDGEMALRPTLRIFVNGMPAGQVFFQLKVVPNAPDYPPMPCSDAVKRFSRLFLSYASEDRVEVLKAAQLLAALKVKYFQDVLQLSPGDRWQSRLYTEIEECDAFLLFWSKNACESEWVIKEAEFALDCAKKPYRRSPLEIVPVLLEGPPVPLPPPSLSEIHFNDPIRHVIFAEESVTKQLSGDRQTRG